MRFNLITNLNNGVGLEHDYRILRAELERLGHEVRGVQFNAPQPAQAADVNIFLEVVAEQFFDASPRQWVIPNPEWWFPGWVSHLPTFEAVLAKTQDCQRIFERHAPGKVKFLGWKSRDLSDQSIPRERSFLHIAGKSQTKNTGAVLECWERFKPKGTLTIVSDWMRNRPIPGVQILRRIPDKVLAELMNRNIFHLMPSAYEGWGHVLHEALAVGAIPITTDAPPMNELATCIRIPPNASSQMNAAVIHSVSAESVLRACCRCLEMSDSEISDWRKSARTEYEIECTVFASRIDALFAEAQAA